jgi:hypothetical protein
LMPGRFAIPAAQLVYSLPLSASFFSREGTHELRPTARSSSLSSHRPRDDPRTTAVQGNLRVAAKLDTVAHASAIRCSPAPRFRHRNVKLFQGRLLDPGERS